MREAIKRLKRPPGGCQTHQLSRVVDAIRLAPGKGQSERGRCHQAAAWKEAWAKSNGPIERSNLYTAAVFTVPLLSHWLGGADAMLRDWLLQWAC